jgi:hypothetical protein
MTSKTHRSSSHSLLITLALSFGAASFNTVAAVNAALAADPAVVDVAVVDVAALDPAVVVSAVVVSAVVVSPGHTRVEPRAERPEPVIVLGEPEIAYETDAEPAARTTASNAKRAASRKHTHAKGPARAPEAEKALETEPKRWVCGAWEELWQGSGQGRSCEWR